MERTAIDRLAVKTLDQRFRRELETGFEIAPRISQGVLDLAKEVFSLDGASCANGNGYLRQDSCDRSSPHPALHTVVLCA